MIKNFRHVSIVVKDLERALRFYRDIMGLKVFKIVSLQGSYPEAVFNKKRVRLIYVKMYAPNQCKGSSPLLELHYWISPRRLPKAGYNHISFTVKNIDYVYRRLRKLGVRFISKPIEAPDKKSKICFGYDPDRNLIEFVEEIRGR